MIYNTNKAGTTSANHYLRFLLFNTMKAALMKKLILASAVAAALAAPTVVLAQTAPAAAAAPASPHTFSANVGVVSDYIFRGISQTHGGPAIQGGVDYSHSSGLYASAWASNVSWVKDAQDTSANVEIDVYGGFKNTFGSSDWNYDLGVISYNYPGTKTVKANNSAKSDTVEVYAGLGWKWLSAKYSYTTSSNFISWYGGPTGTNTNIDTRGSDYLELNANYDLGSGWGINGHIGSQKVKNYQAAGDTNASYMDYKVGGTKDFGWGVLGLAVTWTDTKGTCNGGAGGTNAYCWGKYNAGSNTSNGFYNAAQTKGVLSFLKTF